MTKDEILAAAKEAGLDLMHDGSVPYYMAWQEELQRFANIIEKSTIERCAAVANELRHPDGYSAETFDWCEGTKHSAEAIRALGEQ